MKSCRDMVLILDGNTGHVEHVSLKRNQTCWWRRRLKQMPCTVNQPKLLYTCACISELPSSISSMVEVSHNRKSGKFIKFKKNPQLLN